MFVKRLARGEHSINISCVFSGTKLIPGKREIAFPSRGQWRRRRANTKHIELS